MNRNLKPQAQLATVPLNKPRYPWSSGKEFIMRTPTSYNQSKYIFVIDLNTSDTN